MIPLKKEGAIWKVFLIKRSLGFWEFPKGHQEEGETPLETATRELFEETHLSFKTLLSDTPLESYYRFEKEGKSFDKCASFFLALVQGEPHFDGKETVAGGWFTFDEAAATLTYPSSKELLARVRDFLSGYGLTFLR